MTIINKVFLIVTLFVGISLSVLAKNTSTTGTLMVEMEYNGDTYSIKRAWVIDQHFHNLKSVSKRSNDVLVSISASDNSVVATTQIRNPRILRAPLLMPSESAAQGSDQSNTHSKIIRDTGTFILRLPYSKNVRYIKLKDLEPGLLPSVSAVKLKSDNNQHLDLSPHLSK